MELRHTVNRPVQWAYTIELFRIIVIQEFAECIEHIIFPPLALTLAEEQVLEVQDYRGEKYFNDFSSADLI